MTIPRRSAGVPAIMPRGVTSDPACPSFTEQDVVAYLHHHPPMRGRRYVWAVPATIEAVEFLEAAYVTERLGLPPEMLRVPLVCFVTMRGSCFFHGMRGMAPKQFTTFWFVFDAESGYLLHQQID